MFKLQRLEISGFKSFADHTEIVFTGSGITAVVGPNGCGKSNVSDAMSWVLGEQRAKSLRGGEMKDVVFAGTKTRKPGGMAEVVLHMVRDNTVFDIEESELEDIDEALSGIDEAAVDMDAIEGIDADEVVEAADLVAAEVDNGGSVSEFSAGAPDEGGVEIETVQAAQVGSIRTVETKVKSKRHWRPRSFALDFAPGEAVSVTRRLYLSGESEYQLNGRTCRLRDITDLFAGTGLSGAHYAIIEQGRIGQILSAKPADRRNLIEEAAGISKFRSRQRAAESRLDTAKNNLGRISDIVSEIDKQVNSLRRQAAKTRRFKILQEEFRVLLRQLFAAEGKHLSELSETLKIELAGAIATETDLGLQVTAKEEAVRESTQNARNAEESLAELRKFHSDNALERDRAEREHIYRSEQLVNLNNRSEVLRGEIASSKERLETLAGELERLQKDDRAEAESFGKADSDLKAAEEEYGREAAALQTIETAMETVRAELMQHTAAAERFDEIGRQLEINLEKLSMRVEGLRSEGERAAVNFAEHEKQAAELASTLAAEEIKLQGLTVEKEALLARTNDARAVLRDAESDLDRLSDEYSAKKHRLATLNELEEKRAVYTPQVQKLFAEQESIGVKLGGVLADRLKVAARAERAIETLFGPYLEAVIVDSLEDARRLATWLKDNDIGRTAMLIAPKGNGSASKGRAAVPGSIEDHLGISAEFADTLREVFPREMSATLVEDLSAGAAIAGEIQINFEGEVLLGGRMFIGGKQGSDGKNESLLAFKRELNDLGAAVAKLLSEIDTARGGVEKARDVLVEFESKTVDLQSLMIKVDRGIHGLQIQVRAAREEIERSERHRKVVEDETGQTQSELVELGQRITDAAQNRDAAEKARVEASERLDGIANGLSSARESVEAANLKLNDKRMTAATSGERRRSAQSALRRVENEGREIESRLAFQELEIGEADGKIKLLHTAITEITDRIAAASTDIAGERDALTAAINALAAARENADRMSENLAQLNRAASDALNRRAEIEVRQAETITELKNVGENCEHELNLPLEQLVAEVEFDVDFDLNDARRETESLRQRLDSFGAINMLALEELGEAEERWQFLTTQRQDIIDSIATTEEALREIKQRSREKFRSAFDAINAHFVEFFQELFGGGRGEMTLLESEDILEAGIEVVAQPPGKRLQNILLLSGGEKAMTAIALVMAIFKYRPSPFCLLDEVDAPLDDANVGRFVNKIAEMSEKTQFIVITHNKRTMEAARALYGVTMQEAGVSKVVSVKFE
ncbi:MAG TPA: chromosome segregation protein SMC [Pyrinomonadaceae bacterium]|nr:chromosome segregation protein SMC [Chloracidobacterium sp.]MBP9108050.1 chromosome segregation protein SMC [Pyrinomonadaceae bacterium]MBL0242305.1 chromosome segregation protein SMC [Chloracidobacterium sp.]HQX55832.1 chromosome segregation protein SMC [Pyrinomonadaceae bacterium]HQY66921.1 chromosome segregation protein SMC [Pyrinomonadaceae bacterium]